MIIVAHELYQKLAGDRNGTRRALIELFSFGEILLSLNISKSTCPFPRNEQNRTNFIAPGKSFLNKDNPLLYGIYPVGNIDFLRIFFSIY